MTEQTSSVHLLGTCRMGNDPATSVVDKYHRSHDVRESVPVRRQQPRDLRPRPADDDDSGAGLPRRRAHRAVREAGRDQRIDGAASSRSRRAFSENTLPHSINREDTKTAKAARRRNPCTRCFVCPSCFRVFVVRSPVLRRTRCALRIPVRRLPGDPLMKRSHWSAPARQTSSPFLLRRSTPRSIRRAAR